jgi:hypothetical protein
MNEIQMTKFKEMTNAQMTMNLGARASNVLRSASLPIALGAAADCSTQHRMLSSFGLGASFVILRPQTSLILHCHFVHVNF